MTKSTKAAIAADLRHALTMGSATDPGFLVDRIVGAIADLEGVWSSHQVRDVIDRARRELDREPLP